MTVLPPPKPVLQVVVRTAAHFASRLAATPIVFSYPNTTQIDVSINSTAVVGVAGLTRLPPGNIPLHQLSDTCSTYWLGPQDFCRHACLACYWQNLSSMVVITAVTLKLLWQRALFIKSVSNWYRRCPCTVTEYMLSVALFDTVYPWWQHVQCCCICYLRLNLSTTTIKYFAFGLIIPVGCNYLAGVSCSKLLTLRPRYTARCATNCAKTIYIWAGRLLSNLQSLSFLSLCLHCHCVHATWPGKATHQHPPLQTCRPHWGPEQSPSTNMRRHHTSQSNDVIYYTVFGTLLWGFRK